MPKKTMAQKLRNQRKHAESSQTTQVALLHNDFLSVNPIFKYDMIKSILFAAAITGFEIALYFIYYLRVFERR